MSTPSSPRAERIRSRVVTSRSPVRGSCGRYPIVPLRLTDPAAGNVSPARILVRVVLPAPLRPTRPIVSPGFTGNDTGLSRSLAPARTSTFVTVSTRDHSSRPAQYGRTTSTQGPIVTNAVSYTHLRAHETVLDLVCRLLLEKK